MCSFNIIFILFLPSIESGIYGYKLSTVDTYTSLTNDLVVHYKAKNTDEKLILGVRRYEHVIYTTEISGKKKSGTFIIQCGVVYKPGNYVISMFRQNFPPKNNSLQLLATHSMTVKFPEYEISGVPKFVQTYSFDLKILVSSIDRFCKPISSAEVNGTLIELFAQSATGAFDKKRYTQTLPVWYNINNIKVDIPCQSIDHPAKYRIRLKTLYQVENEIRSAILSQKYFNATWNQKYSMVIPESFFPCRHQMKIYYTYPNICRKKQSDRMRLYGLLKPNVSSPDAPPAGVDYITEGGVDDGGSFSFPCDIISPSYSHICIKYIVVSTYGSVYDAITKCRPTYSSCKNDKCKFESIIPAKWSEWSSWSPCSKSCGTSTEGTTQVRHRLCLSALYRGKSPNKAGKDCNGTKSQSRRCKFLPLCPENIPITEEESPLKMLKPDRCTCGCTINITKSESSNNNIISTSSDKCKSTDNVWLLRSTSKFHEVCLHFLYINVTTSGVWIKVRDGDHYMSPLLTFGSINSDISENITSTNGVLRINFHFSNSAAMEKANDTYGFIAIYELRRTENLVQVLLPPQKKAGVLNLTAFHLLIVSLVICWCFAVLVATFIIRKYRKGKLARYSSVHSCSSARSVMSVVPITPLTTPQRQKRLLRQKLKDTLANATPEDYLADAGHLLFSPLEKQRPIATINPQPAKVRFPSTSTLADDVIMRHRKKSKVKAQRESQAPLTASVSELSVGGDEYEYDYYDIGGHYQMGSYFNAETGYGWDDHTYDVILSPDGELQSQPSDMVAMKELKPSGTDK